MSTATAPIETPFPKALAAFPTLRQSILSEFDNCAQTTAFSLRFREGWSGHPQARGQLFHRFAGEALRVMHREQEPEIEVSEALTILDEIIRQKDADAWCPYCGSGRIRRGVRKDGKRRCLDCRQPFESEMLNLPISHEKDLRWVVVKWAHDNAFDVVNLAGIERRLEATVEYPGREMFSGRVSRTLSGQLDALLIVGDYDEDAIVLDWKDTWAMPPESEIEGYFQQRWYALLVLENYPSVQRVILRECYVRYSETREASVLRESLDQLRAEFSALAERFDRAFERNVWRPSPGKHCSVCIAPEHCPIFPEARDEGAIETPEDAAQAAAEILVAEVVLKRRRKQLANWTQTRGPVKVRYAKGRREFGHRETVTTLRPKLEEIERLRRELGREPTVEEVGGLFRERVGSRFGDYAPAREVAPGAAPSSEEFMEALTRTLDERKKGGQRPLAG